MMKVELDWALNMWKINASCILYYHDHGDYDITNTYIKKSCMCVFKIV
jgi:hypothetical protein